MSRYDQKHSHFVAPTWQDEWLSQEPGRVGLPVPSRAARQDYPAGKPITYGPDRHACDYSIRDNSFYSNSPHWDYPWLDARMITATAQPMLFSCFDRQNE